VLQVDPPPCSISTPFAHLFVFVCVWRGGGGGGGGGQANVCARALLLPAVPLHAAMPTPPFRAGVLRARGRISWLDALRCHAEEICARAYVLHVHECRLVMRNSVASNVHMI